MTETTERPSVEHVQCVTITCASCKDMASFYDDAGTVHYDSVDEARQRLIDDHAESPELRWTEDGEAWFCPDCTALRACEAAGGHDMGPWIAPYYAIGPRGDFRTCQRGHCTYGERRPDTDGETDA